jgi:hypothetical protein
MARVWGEDPTVPNDALLASAEMLVDEARRLAGLSLDRSDFLLNRLFDALAIWSVPVHRWATSGPSHHRESLRRFADHPEAGTGNAFDRYRSGADELAFYAIGADAVLETFANFEVFHRGHAISAGTSSWPTYMGLIDAADLAGQPSDATEQARFLSLTLMEGRHRLVAHRRFDHAAIVGWDFGGVPETTLIRLPLPWDDPQAAERERTAAHEGLLEVLGRIRLRLPPRERWRAADNGEPDSDLLNRLLDLSDYLRLRDRMEIASSMASGIYATRHPNEIVQAVLAMTSAIV